MKVAFGLMAFLALICVGVYYFGGFGKFDPTAQGRQVKASLKPGMTHKQVFDIAGDPRKYRVINRKVKRVHGQDIETLEAGPEVEGDRSRIEARIAEGSLPNGFVCLYYFSHQIAINVRFDGKGTLVDVSDAPTLADLLQTKQ
jgi:hypothetical protein